MYDISNWFTILVFHLFEKILNEYVNTSANSGVNVMGMDDFNFNSNARQRQSTSGYDNELSTKYNKMLDDFAVFVFVLIIHLSC